jgi:hypothetical protein
MNFKKSISAFLYKDTIIIAAKKRSISGLEYIKEKFEKLSFDAPPEDISNCILKLLEEFETGAKDLKKDEFKIIFKPILEAVNCKSYNNFWKVIKHVPISLDNNIITFYATENFGPKGGYSGNIMPKIELNVNSVSSVNLSEALKQTFELSTIA